VEKLISCHEASNIIICFSVIHRVPGGKVNILGGHGISHSTQKKCICTCVLFRTVSEIELFHCTVPKLLIKKKYYVMFLIPVFIVEVTKLVQFTEFNTFSKIPPSTSIHFATRLYSVQCTVQWNSSISETVQNRTHIHIQFLFRMTDNIDLSSWDNLYTRIGSFPLSSLERLLTTCIMCTLSF
jgi:hypothetical protein